MVEGASMDGLERRRHLMPEPRAPAGTAVRSRSAAAAATGVADRWSAQGGWACASCHRTGAAPAGPSGARVRVGCLPAPGEHRFRAAETASGISPPQPKQGKQSATGHHARRSADDAAPEAQSPMRGAGVDERAVRGGAAGARPMPTITRPVRRRSSRHPHP